ncbi:MAG TPA: CocE/NonD family hydrolase [Thermoanaerobaculia bacterium]|nr:CocE/NonD family hydrolase [Thermoanaerobaculia bacterium]
MSTTMVQPLPRLLADLRVPARDGSGLATDVLLPESPGAHPTIVVRTPYGRRRPFLYGFARHLNAAGFNILLQDCRSSADGDGGFLEHEESDGLATLEWLAGQPWADGQVGLLSLCISNLSNFLALTASPPPGIEIRTVANVIGVTSMHSSFYQQGALRLHHSLPWAVMLDPRWASAQAAWQQLPWDHLFRHLPVAGTAEEAGGASVIWQRLALAQPAYSADWETFDVRHRLAGLRTPVLHLSGWYDITLDQVLDLYGRLRSAAPGAPEQRLIVGPWDHSSIFASFLRNGIAATELGARAPINLLPVLRQWFERWFAGPRQQEAAACFAAQPETLLFVMDEEAWIGADGFPLAQATFQDFYLATGADRRGALVPRPAAAGEDSFLYDPEDPVPTRGGLIWPFASQGLVPGPADQSELENRRDILVYDSPPLAEDLVIAGPVEVDLWAATSAVDTDFTAKLVDAAPDGTARVIQDGIVRGRFRQGPVREELLEPHRPYLFRISLLATAHRFRAGHRVRLEVSSSNFPKFDRNLNTGDPLHTGTAGIPAAQTVFHGGARPSQLRLPVLSGPTLEALRWTPPAEWRVISKAEGERVARTA